ncbi:MAG: alpha/beta hydrolase, partial [Dongiaceae bacterium]
MGFVLGVLVAVAGVYLAGLAYLWATQRSHVFHPGPGPLDLTGSSVAPFMREITVTSPDGLTLTAWYARAKPGRRTIAYFHGNAGTLADRQDRVLPYLKRGFGVLLIGYRGYGGNPGLPTEPGLYDDARAHLDWLARHDVGNDDVALYGESLGA